MARRRRYSDPEVLHVAYMAGAGASASEIAYAIGRTTEAKVYSLCARHGIKLLHKTPHQVAFPIVMSRKTFALILDLATERAACPLELASAVLDEVVAEPIMLRNLVDEIPALRLEEDHNRAAA